MKKYVVELTNQERKQLEGLIKKGKVAGYKIRHAQMLLKADQSKQGLGWRDKQIAEAFGAYLTTVERLRRRFVEEGLQVALERHKRQNYSRKLDGDAEAQLIAIACSEPPEGRNEWTLRLLADRLVELSVVDTISHMTVKRTLEKNELKPWRSEQWCIPPEANGEFVACMEDVLDVYKRPYDPKFPKVCFDETNRQLIAETRKTIRAKPGQSKRKDYEYHRNGVVNVFMMFEPLKARRHVKVTEQRTRKDFAQCIRDLVDVHYPEAEKIVLVLDNLNIHSTGSLYEEFEPAEARRLANKLEIHHTPKHGSWLNMAEIEIGVLSRQCLYGYIPTKEQMISEVATWQSKRNRANATADWQFTTTDARVKLKRLYPVI